MPSCGKNRYLEMHCLPFFFLSRGVEVYPDVNSDIELVFQKIAPVHSEAINQV